MSQLGHQRRFERAPATSALPPISDILPSRSKRRFGPIASFERRRHVCFNPNYGRITATQRTDALGQFAT